MKDGQKIFYGICEPSNYNFKIKNRSQNFFTGSDVMTFRLASEINDLKNSILINAAGDLVKTYQLLWQQSQNATEERKKEIMHEFEKAATQKIFEAGYTPNALHDTNFTRDPKLASELLERLSTTLKSFDTASLSSSLWGTDPVKEMEVTVQNMSKEKIIQTET